jgi:hypothetical protein
MARGSEDEDDDSAGNFAEAHRTIDEVGNCFTASTTSETGSILNACTSSAIIPAQLLQNKTTENHTQTHSYTNTKHSLFRKARR